jgi:hypothetical protein
MSRSAVTTPKSITFTLSVQGRTAKRGGCVRHRTCSGSSSGEQAPRFTADAPAIGARDVVCDGLTRPCGSAVWRGVPTGTRGVTETSCARRHDRHGGALQRERMDELPSRSLEIAGRTHQCADALGESVTRKHTTPRAIEAVEPLGSGLKIPMRCRSQGGAQMARPAELRFIPRAQFARNHFPQAKCAPCQFRRVCQDLLAADPKDMWENVWLVRGDNGGCARGDNGGCARDSALSDVRSLQEREMARCPKPGTDPSPGLDWTLRPRPDGARVNASARATPRRDSP